MRVVFDVNVLMRLTFGSRLVARLIRAANDGAFMTLATDVLMDELAETARKPRLSKRVDPVVYNELVTFLREEAEFVRLAPPFPSCRDQDDDYLLAMARDGGADFLVTRDDDLLSLGRVHACEIVTPEEFERRLVQ